MIYETGAFIRLVRSLNEYYGHDKFAQFGQGYRRRVTNNNVKSKTNDDRSFRLNKNRDISMV